jgi:Flp pilus assembly protein TadD
VAPGTLEAHRALGAVAMAERDFEQARVHYRAVLDLEPLDQDAHERLALVSASAGTTGSRFPLRGFRHRR